MTGAHVGIGPVTICTIGCPVGCDRNDRDRKLVYFTYLRDKINLLLLGL